MSRRPQRAFLFTEASEKRALPDSSLVSHHSNDYYLFLARDAFIRYTLAHISVYVWIVKCSAVAELLLSFVIASVRPSVCLPACPCAKSFRAMMKMSTFGPLLWKDPINFWGWFYSKWTKDFVPQRMKIQSNVARWRKTNQNFLERGHPSHIHQTITLLLAFRPPNVILARPLHKNQSGDAVAFLWFWQHL